MEKPTTIMYGCTVVRTLLLLLLLTGCLGGEPYRPEPVIKIYNQTVKTTTTQLQKVTTTTTRTTTTQLQKVTTTSTTTTTTTTTTIPRTAPRIEIPANWDKCEINAQCILVTDCCGINGRQYAINRAFIKDFKQIRGDCDKEFKCIVTADLQSMRYKYAGCRNGLCYKTYDFPQE